jgi:hypothetical protein
MVPELYINISKDIVPTSRNQRINGDLVSRWVRSQENFEFLNQFLLDKYNERMNQFGSPIISEIELRLKAAIDNHEGLIYLPMKQSAGFINNLDYMTFINAYLVKIVSKQIDAFRCETIDPQWTDKGPGFRATPKNWDTIGNLYAMELSPLGNPTLVRRFQESKMYWNRFAQ